MKLAAKLILVFLFGVFAIVSVFTWQTLRRQNDWEVERRTAHASDIADALTPTIKQAYEEGGTITVKRALEVSTRQLDGPEVRWVDGKDTSSQLTQTTSRETSSISITDANGNRKAYSYIPIPLGESDSGTVEVSEPLEEQDAFTRGSVIRSLMSLLGVAAFSGVVIYFGGIQLIGKPLNRLVVQVKQIGEGQLDQTPVVTSHDELGRLAIAISEMSRRIHQQLNTIRHTNRLGTIGTLSAGIAHELGTPLNVISGRAGLIKSGKLTTEEIVHSAETIQSEANRMTTIIRQLLDFSRQKSAPYSSIDLNGVIRRTCDLMQTLTEKANIQLATNLPAETLYIDGDVAQIQQVLSNLITNAIAAMPNGGMITINLQKNSQDEIQIQVIDSGVGIELADVNQVFEPFYTTKDVGQGTGLGLSIAYGIVREHSGEIQVSSNPETGTTFTITFPASDSNSVIQEVSKS
ncbi:sensor histidine kinase [Rubinisphaera italica]|uniref:histidine kinase n=1 Tax=Rubinisphaera italica TaxID=2527969 RepID=A0A5C5XL13_9PLAN|nr:HAMP domain-containing sensor histidine kinase [Rubinisphaera italica]TWT63398.1 Sporulation kinase A [Rubinisphaera italica]